MYGKALAEYLQAKLAEKGYSVPFICAEDWGWWVELKTDPLRSGICIYARPETSDPIEYVCTDRFNGERKWSWSKFRFLDTKPLANQLHEDLLATFRADDEVQVVAKNFPFNAVVYVCFSKNNVTPREHLRCRRDRPYAAIPIERLSFIG